MAKATRGNTWMIKNTDLECLTGELARSMKVDGSKGSSTEWEQSSWRVENEKKAIGI